MTGPAALAEVASEQKAGQRFAWSALVLAAYFLFCLAVQVSSGAWQADFVAHSDEPSHFVGAVMVRDWLLSGQWTTPMRFASNYYAHYPFFAVGYWPPMFYLVTAFGFLVTGVGRIQCLLIPAICAAITARVLFRLLVPRIGPVPSFCAGAVYLSLPTVQQWFCAAMVDHLTACLCVAAAACLLRYLERPDYPNGVMLAVLCGCATLSKYSGAYTVVLPFAAILFFRRFSLLRRPSFLFQPVIIAAMLVPWILWTRGLASYGLPPHRAALTVARFGSFLMQTFAIFPPVLLIIVVLGLIALLVRPDGWRQDVGVLALLVAGHLSLLFFSNVGAEPRYMLAPAGALLAISFVGWGEASARVPVLKRYRRAVYPSAAILTATFLLVYSGRYVRPSQYPIRPIVKTILKNRAWENQRVLAPSDLEGAFIAEFAAQDRRRPSVYILRPGRVFAHSDWFDENYVALFHEPEQILHYLQQNQVRVIIWHDRSDGPQSTHERLLAEMLRRYPLSWRRAGTFGANGEPLSWTIYEQVNPLESR